MRGFKDIHSHNVVHRDLKLANILIHFDNLTMQDYFKAQSGGFDLKDFKKKTDLIGNAKLYVADLGFAKQLDEYCPLTETMLGTPLYMAPEIFEGKAYSHKVDVWALGVVFYAMLTGYTPFRGSDKADLKKNLRKGDYQLPPKIQLSTLGLDFINSCLQHNPHKRASWEELQ